MAHTDLSLAFHRVADRVYELSGLRTGSVRDQMVRAVLLVQALKHAGRIGSSEHQGLLIVGGGAAGIAAAMTASELEVPSLLLEKEDNLVSSQAAVTTRIIDPTEFDWPQPHWREGSFPHRPLDQPLPLDFDRGVAADLAWDWLHDFHIWCTTIAAGPTASNGYAPVELELSCDVSQRTVAGGVTSFYAQRNGEPGAPQSALHWDDTTVYLEDWPSSGLRRRFGAVLSCVGFGTENVTVPCKGNGSGIYEGYGFWSEDPFCEHTLGLSSPRSPIRALVSGGGDGAQQDFQRLLTRRFGKELFDAIAGVDYNFPKKIDLGKLALADDEGRRAHAWQSVGKRPNAALMRWHEAFDQEAERLWQTWGEVTRDHLQAALLRDQVNMQVTWIVQSSSPSYSFGLNRLLTLLLARLHARATNRSLVSHGLASTLKVPVLLFDESIDHVEGVAHACSSAEKCNGKTHDIYLKRPTVPKLLGKFEVVVIRHGMQTKPLFGEPPVPEQLVPFSFPE